MAYWKIEIDIEPSEDDLEYIGNMIKEGYTEGVFTSCNFLDNARELVNNLSLDQVTQLFLDHGIELEDDTTLSDAQYLLVDYIEDETISIDELPQ